MSYNRKALTNHNIRRTGYRFRNQADPDQREFRDDNMGRDEYLASLQNPHIPAITEDPDAIPHEFDPDGNEELVDNGGIPYKRPRIHIPEVIDMNADPVAIEFRDRTSGGAPIYLYLNFPDPDWDTFSYVNNRGLRHFFQSMLPDEDDAEMFGNAYGPFDGFNTKMSTAEVNVNQRDFVFDSARQIIPYIAYMLGCMAMWLKHHMEFVVPDRDSPYYKAMVNMHCVFVKDYHDPAGAHIPAGTPEREYRRFIFDKMCEDDTGQYLQARNDRDLFKIVYNSYVRLCYEKLDDNVMPHVPEIDSRFIFYSIRSACVTVFQYEPMRVGKFISLPPALAKSRCVINPRTEFECFRYSILLGVLVATVRRSEYAGVYNLGSFSIMNRLFSQYHISANFDSLPESYFTYDEKILDRFCADNPDIFLTIWVMSDRKEDRVPLHPIYQSMKTKVRQKEIHLLLMTDLDGAIDYTEELTEDQRPMVDHHYACIANIDGLFYKYSGKHHVHICPVCKIRRRIDTKGMGFCKIHEFPQYHLAMEKTFKNTSAIKDAVMMNDPLYENITLTFCPRCANDFECEEKLMNHMEECLVRDNNFRIINLPKERQYLELSGKDKIKMTMLHTFMVADFESVLSPVGSFSGNQYFESEHVPCSYSLVMESDYQQLCKFKAFIGHTPEETIADFCETILAWSKEVHFFYRSFIPMEKLSREQMTEFVLATNCYICGKVFTRGKGNHKVRDHDHLTGKYLGAACEGCNINRRPDRMYIPLFFHNGKNYDTHLLIKEITKAKYDCKFEGIAQNSQKIMSFKIIKFTNDEMEDGSIVTNRCMCDIKVLDSILFLLSSLSKLTEVQKHKSHWDGTPETEELNGGYVDVFPITYKWLRLIYTNPNSQNDIYDPKITLALRKNAYPYLWFDDFKKFELPIGELTRLFDERRYEAFTENVTDEFKANFERNCEIYHRVIDAYGFQYVGQYVKLYVCMDTLQLADILQETRKVYQRVHKLDMFQFFGLPGYTWAAFQLHIDKSPFKPWLFMEGEMDMVCFIARAIRGGCSGSMLRYSHVNNPNMEDQDMYDPEKPHKFLIYLDANNLYGWSMSQDLPYGDFEWVRSDYIDLVNAQKDDFHFFKVDFLNKLGAGRGAYIMCDLEFPKETHDVLNWYPLAPMTGCVPEEWISNFSRMMHEVAGTKHDTKSRLLLQTLTKREKYVVYYKNLQFYLKHGMKITKIYKILKFSEAPIMRSYIDLNTQQRNQAESTAEKNQWKNANNSAYGKTFENQLNYSILKFVSGEDQFNKAVRDPGFDGYAFISDNLMLAKMKHTSVDFNKPIYLGATITELAKLHMFEFYYDVLMDHFGKDNLKLCMTDTDSLLCEVVCDDIYQETATIQFKYDCPLDTSTLSKSVTERYSIIGNHNKEVGYFKFEADPQAIQEFVGLRPKVYSAKEADDPEAHMRCKGTPKSSMELYVRHENYLRCLFHNYAGENMRQNVDVNMIRSKDHDLFSIKTSKVSLSCNDSKRYILRDNIHTLAYGHYAIRQYEKVYEKQEPLDEDETMSPLIQNIPELPIKGVL